MKRKPNKLYDEDIVYRENYELEEKYTLEEIKKAHNRFERQNEFLDFPDFLVNGDWRMKRELAKDIPEDCEVYVADEVDEMEIEFRTNLKGLNQLTIGNLNFTLNLNLSDDQCEDIVRQIVDSGLIQDNS